MNEYPRTAGYIVLSAILSIGIHFLLWNFADRLAVGIFNGTEEEEAPRRIDISMVNVRDLYQPPKPVAVEFAETEEELKRTIKENSEKVKSIFEEAHLIEKPKPKLQLTGLGAPKKPQNPEVPPQQAEAPRPSILEIEAQDLPSDRRALDRMLTPKLPRKNIDEAFLPSLLTGDDFRKASGASFDVSMNLSLPKASPFAVGDLARPGGGGADDEGRRSGFSPFAELPGFGSQFSRTADGGSPIEELDSLLTVRMHTFEESDGSGYFRIDIAPNPRSDKLKAIPKDILFLIDSSTSISPIKLEHFKNAVLEALAYLNRSDRFNIVSFRDRPEQLFAAYTPITDETLERARGYLRNLQRGGMTDVYAGLAPFISAERSQNDRPLNVFLMTDGKSTVKNALDNESMIRQVTAVNAADVSVYTFSAGADANLFLMDFLAYTNRGQSLHQEKLTNFKDQLVGFIATHSELIISDLRYQITGGMRETIYPRKLPHLYRGETLAVYGRYPAGTEELAIQLIGQNANGKLEELIFRGNIGTTRRSDSTLSRDWAAQKIFHLVAQRTLNPTLAVRDEIRRLAEKHRLFVPYL